MQTKINATMAMGVPGEHGNTQPYFADSYIASANVTMGTPVVVTGTTVAPASGSTADGIAVSPHEHVRMVLPDGTQSLVVKAGDTVAVAKKGSWFVAIPDSALSVADGVVSCSWAVGGKLAVSSGALAQSNNGTFAVITAMPELNTELNEAGTTATFVGTHVACIRLI